MAAGDMQERLVRWAEWLLRSSGGGLGFPRECSYTRMQARGGEGFVGPEVDLESDETERAVQALNEKLKRTVQVYYLVNGTREQQARLVGCHRVALDRRIQMAHGLIQQFLDEELRVRRKKVSFVA